MPLKTAEPDEMDSMYSSDSKAPVKPPEDAQEDDGGATAVIDNKVLSPDGEPLKEGDEVVVTVVKNYGDECEVKYAPKKESSEGEGMGADSELDSMSSKGRDY